MKLTKRPVGNDRNGVARQQGAAPLGTGRPMEDRAPLEVAARLDQRQSGQRLERSFPVLDRGIRSHDPLAIGCRNVDRRAGECQAPFDADAVEMRVRHCDAVEPSSLAHRRDAIVVNESQAVPEEVPGLGLHQ